MSDGPDSPPAGGDPVLRLPAYDELPAAPCGGRSAWGLFGASDSVGLLNLQTPARVADAARLVHTGQVFSLNAPLDALDPPLFMRGALRHTVTAMGESAFDDKLDNYYPQASSQWDSLGHVGYDADQFYNGATVAEIQSKSRNTIEHWARRGSPGAPSCSTSTPPSAAPVSGSTRPRPGPSRWTISSRRAGPPASSGRTAT